MLGNGNLDALLRMAGQAPGAVLSTRSSARSTNRRSGRRSCSSPTRPATTGGGVDGVERAATFPRRRAAAAAPHRAHDNAARRGAAAADRRRPGNGDMIRTPPDGVSFRHLVGPSPASRSYPSKATRPRTSVRVLDGNGDIDHPVFLGPAPDPPPRLPHAGAGAEPVNYLELASPRRVAPRSTEATGRQRLRDALGATRDGQSGHHVLYGRDGQGRPGLRVHAGLVRRRRRSAHTFGFVSDGGGGEPSSAR